MDLEDEVPPTIKYIAYSVIIFCKAQYGKCQIVLLVLPNAIMFNELDLTIDEVISG